MVVGTIIGASIFVQPSEITAPSRRSPASARLAGGRRAHAVRRAASAPSSRRRFRGPAASTCSCARCSRPPPASSGAGRCSGACTPASSPRSRWCSRATPATFVADGRYRHPRLTAVGAHRRAVRGQLRRRPAGQRACRRRSRSRRCCRGAIVGARLVLLGAGASPHAPRPPPATCGSAGFLLAIVAGLFAFGGWHMVTYTAEETRNPDAHDSARADDRHASSSTPATSG